MHLLEDNNPKWITPDQVKDGEVCIIRKHISPSDIGKVLHRYTNVFISIGEKDGLSYSSLHTVKDGSVLLEVLPAGTKLEL